LKTLKTWKIDGRLLGFTNNFMNDRTLKVGIGKIMSSFKNIENGVPQGAVLSVTLFLVAMAKICDKIEEPTKILGDANDWMLYTSPRTRRMAENELQRSANKIMKLANEIGFTIFDEKTKMLLVHIRRPRVQSRPTLKIWIRECMLGMVGHHRILGLILNQNLNWKEHLRTVKARATKT
jgi:hypothetical protein